MLIKFWSNFPASFSEGVQYFSNFLYQFLIENFPVLSKSEIDGLHYVISGLVGYGGMAAAMSTADGLIL